MIAYYDRLELSIIFVFNLIFQAMTKWVRKKLIMAQKAMNTMDLKTKMGMYSCIILGSKLRIRAVIDFIVL